MNLMVQYLIMAQSQSQMPMCFPSLTSLLDLCSKLSLDSGENAYHAQLSEVVDHEAKLQYSQF